MPALSANAKPKILIATVDVLGWRTYASRIREYASHRDDLNVIYLTLRPSLAQRVATMRWPFSDHKIVDPIDFYRLKVHRWWRREGRFLGIDAVHLATQVCAAAFAELTPKVPYSLAVDVTRRLSTRELGAPDFSARTIRLENFIYAQAYFIAALSQWSMTSLRDDYDISPTKMLRCLPSVSILPMVTRQVSRSLPSVLFVGNDFIRKGGDRLLEWHQRYFVDRATLHIVSSKARARTHRNVRWHGRVENATLISTLYPTAAVFCLPTRSDMSSWVIAEASSFGIPSVASRVGGISEVCVHGQTGFVISPNDDDGFVAALERLLSDRQLRSRMGVAARRYAEEQLNSSITYRALFDHILAGI